MQSSEEHEEAPDQTSDPSATPSRLQSFVYPIRSLLGNIQPSGDNNVFDAILAPPPVAVQSPLPERTEPPLHPSRTQPYHESSDVQGESSETAHESYTFRHFPAEEAQRSFATKRHLQFMDATTRDVRVTEVSNVPHAIVEHQEADGTTIIQETDVVAPEPVQSTSNTAHVLQESISEANAQWRTSMAARQAALNRDDEATPEVQERKTRSPSMLDSERDFALSGLVHLAPVEKLDAQKRTREWRGRLGSAEASSAGSAQPSASAKSKDPSGPAKSNQDQDQAREKSGSFSVTTASSDGPVVTMRFEHAEDEDGHHVLTGREGKLTRCEDEPIRIPGSVQGFGVLLVLHDDFTSGQLKVRQVSENSKILLGLSPKYLFNLNCFTDTLPSTQADLLWDNVQFLNDPDSGDEEDEDENPQVFLLSGWGEPKSAMEATTDQEQRRQWTCWIAAHRIRVPKSEEGVTTAPNRKLIILEFELENDPFNPLYPQPNTPSATSDISSPFGRSGTASSASSGTQQQGNDTPGLSESSQGTTPSDATPQPQGEQSTTMATRAQPGPISERIEEEWVPSAEAIISSTTSRSRPLKSLERMRRFSRHGSSSERSAGGHRTISHGVGTMDVFTVLQEINEQLGKALDLLQLLEIVVGIVKDLTQFHRVLCYQFDDAWNGQVVAELVDWSQTHELYQGLHFPAGDIPAQARQLYALNHVRLIYDRAQTTARLVVKDRSDLEPPLDMTHCYLRAVSPIHLKYLGNMHVRASMSISIVAFQKLWGLLACHSYGNHGMRVSFPVRQMLRLLSDSVSRNVERLSYAQRLRTRKLISTVPTNQHPTGYIVSNSEDLLTLFDADCGVLVIGEGAKILGPNEHGQDILLLAEYLRVKQFTLLQVSQSVMQDYPDLQLPSGLDVISGLLYVPLSITGRDFIALLRKGQASDVHWAGKPPITKENGDPATLEPRTSFKLWTEKLLGRCRAWTDEQLDTAAVLALVYGKFIEVWRQKESAVQMNQMTTLLLSNASHEVRTPLHQIINYLELALDNSNGPRLDEETRENLTRSHAASKALLFTINDLLDLTRLEAGKETSFNEPFDLHLALHDAVKVYRVEAARRQLDFQIDLGNAPRWVIGDMRKVKTVVANLTSNAVKYTQEGSVLVTAHTFEEPDGLRASGNVAVEIVVSDTGCGIQPERLESIFREFEQVDSTGNQSAQAPRTGLGLGLAVVARVVEQLGGQLRVDSKIDQGSRFSCLLPFPTAEPGHLEIRSSSVEEGGSGGSNISEIDSLVEALSTSHMVPHIASRGVGTAVARRPKPRKVRAPVDGKFEVEDSYFPVRGLKIDELDVDAPTTSIQPARSIRRPGSKAKLESKSIRGRGRHGLRILVVEDDLVNARVLKKRLLTDGHQVIAVVNGQQAVDLVETDRDFDCVLMDIQMPILDGFGATKAIRKLEREKPLDTLPRRSAALSGRIPIFAVSASLTEDQRDYMVEIGMDGWILKPIEFKRMSVILAGINDIRERQQQAYHEGCIWEYGGWLVAPSSPGVGMYEDESPASEPKSTPSSLDPSPMSQRDTR